MVATGDIWEGHELLSELDRGMLRTFLARQLGDTRDLVWLHLREGASIERSVFVQQIERLQRISDKVPQIVRVRYGGISGSVAWAASSVVESEAIRLKAATRAADLGLTALKMLIEIGECLDRAHKHHALHGALSPDRVFIADSGYLFTQFGFAALFQIPEEDAVREACYAPPELIFGGQLGNRTDVYGLGTVMYELICRRDLYSDEEHRTDSAKTWEPRFPIVVPAGLRHVMQVALARDPKKRYSDVAQMLTVLRAIAKKWEESGSPPASPPGEAGTVSLPTYPKQPDAEWEPFATEDDDPHGPSDIGRSIDEDGPSASPSTPKTSIERTPVDDPGERAAPSPPAVHASGQPEQAPAASASMPSSGGPTRRRQTALMLGAVLALAVLLWSAGTPLGREHPPRAVLHLAQLALTASVRAHTLPSPSPPPACAAPRVAPSAIAPRPRTTRHAGFTTQAMRTPSQDPDTCDGIVPCGSHVY